MNGGPNLEFVPIETAANFLGPKSINIFRAAFSTIQSQLRPDSRGNFPDILVKGADPSSVYTLKGSPSPFPHSGSDGIPRHMLTLDITINNRPFARECSLDIRVPKDTSDHQVWGYGETRSMWLPSGIYFMMDYGRKLDNRTKVCESTVFPTIITPRIDQRDIVAYQVSGDMGGMRVNPTHVRYQEYENGAFSAQYINLSPTNGDAEPDEIVLYTTQDPLDDDFIPVLEIVEDSREVEQVERMINLGVQFVGGRDSTLDILVKNHIHDADS